MSLSEDVDLEEFVTTKDDLSGADIKAVCTEAGLLALRERRMRVTKADFTAAREKVCHVSMDHSLHASLTSILIAGAISQERGDTRRSLFVAFVT
jgi:ATP-dependent 26S proteasome regulatory subunit